MDLETYIRKTFPQGLTYREAAQLILRLYCPVDGIPELLKSECSKERPSDIFSALAESDFLNGESPASGYYGAEPDAVSEKGYWLKLITSGWPPSGWSDRHNAQAD